MEKRHFERHATNVPASARARAAEPIACVIRNYCSGGLFLDVAAPEAITRARVRSGDPIYIRFPAPSIPGQPGVRLHAEVARVEDSGFGVAFRHGDPAVPEAVSALRRLAREREDSSAGQSTGSARDSARLRSLLERSVAMFFEKLRSNCAKLFVRAHRALFEAAAGSSDTQSGQEYFRASEIARTQAGALEAAWLGDLAASAAQAGAGASRALAERSSASGAELELVEKAGFDRWVVLAGLASRIEARLQPELFPLEQRLSYLTGATVGKETNPIGPSAVIWSLSKALDPFNLRIEAQRMLLRGLEGELRSVLGAAYATVNAELSHAGVLPDIERRPRAGSASQPGARTSPQIPRLGRQASAFSALGKVLSFPGSRQPRALAAEASSGKSSAAASPYGREQVLEALSQLQATRKQPLPDEVQATLQRGAGREKHGGFLPEDIQSILAASEQLVESFKVDEGVDRMVAPALERIEVPLAKVAVEQPDFLRDPDHPAVQLVNELGRLSLALSAEPENARRSSEVNNLIARVSRSLVQDRRAGRTAFAEARDTLAPYVREYEQLFAHNVERVIEVCEGQERLDEAKQAVHSALLRTIGQETVPAPVNELLLLGWPALLTLTWLDGGPESDAWSRYLGAVEALLGLLGARAEASLPGADTRAAVLDTLERGLAQVPYDPVRQQALMERLRRALEGDSTLLQRLSQERQPARLEALKSARSHGESPGPRPEQVKALAAWLPTIRSVADGDWLVERRSRDLSRPISLVWTSPREERFVFVDGRGFRALDRTLPELARDLESGRISVLEDGRLPLVERAVQRVLRRSYEEVVYDSAHDPLTGLINRRTFEKHIGEAVQRARSEHSHTVLLILDLDRFKLINDLCGHEGGDRLLKEVAAVVRTYLRGESVIARTGDDEFGILLRDCTRDAGYEVAETERRAIENMDFRLEGRRFAVSASLGLVDIDEHSESASRVLMQADSACFLAKEAGRNVTKVFEISDSEVQRHQGALHNLPIVEEAVQEDRLRLYLQLIEPVFLDEGLQEHYEVLLRVLDKDGHAISPEDFILAAEQYDRMRSLDRWVIEHIFGWINDHAGDLHQVGGFSINLSGHSLGDDAMLQLIMGHLERTPLPRARIAFEITETAMVRNLAAAQAFVEQLKQAGCKLYLDDFGTGMSSYSYLKSFPLDCVKIDGSFVRNIATDEKDLALVRSITEIAHFSKRLVIAEHVETEAVLVRLREIGVDFVQGYAIGRPFPLGKLLPV